MLINAENKLHLHGHSFFYDVVPAMLYEMCRFFLSVGVPYARARTWRVQSMQQQRTGSALGTTGKGSGGQQTDSTGGKSKRRTRSRAAADSDGKEDFHGAGAIS